MTPAGRLQDHLKRVVQKSGGQYRKVRWEGRRGCPDCYVWWTWPKAAFIEIKADGDRYSKLQAREVGRMRDAGIPVFTARTIEDIDEIVKKVQKGVAT
jgi:predicted alpha-1,6-mannanase (GH76 family)